MINEIVARVAFCYLVIAIEVNGKGTLILCEATVFQRNPDMPRAEVEEEFKNGLGVTNIIWMKKGLAERSTSISPSVRESAR